MAPALVCLLLGGVLGVWGWTQRDTSRDRMVADAEAEAERRFDGFEGVGQPTFDQQVWICDLLISASMLETPGASGLVDAATVPAPEGAPATIPSAQLAAELISVLSPDVTLGVAGLDTAEVQLAVADLRAALIAASSTGTDVRADPTVAAKAQGLGDAVVAAC